MTDTDFFDDAVEIATGPPRDRWGRPLLLPREQTEETARVAYTRASSLADQIANMTYLHTWRMRYLARGIATNYDLALLAAAEFYTTGFERNHHDREVKRAHAASGQRLDEIIERAMDRMRIAEGADYGTAIHLFTEPGHPVQAPEQVPSAPDNETFNPQRDVESFHKALGEHGIKILATEVFTACDELRVAGTFDHLCYVPGLGIIITDKKTSKEVHGHDFKVQLSAYANGDPYNLDDDSRMTLEQYVETLGYDPKLINRDAGLIFWIKDGKTELDLLDLQQGHEAAKVAAWVRDSGRSLCRRGTS